MDQRWEKGETTKLIATGNNRGLDWRRGRSKRMDLGYCEKTTYDRIDDELCV